MNKKMIMELAMLYEVLASGCTSWYWDYDMLVGVYDEDDSRVCYWTELLDDDRFLVYAKDLTPGHLPTVTGWYTFH